MFDPNTISLLAAGASPLAPVLTSGLVCLATGMWMASAMPRRGSDDSDMDYGAKILYCRLTGSSLAVLGLAMALAGLVFSVA
jgi:hypothetical protein